MVVACGAEARIGNKYGQFVDEAKKHAQSISPFIAIQFGLIVGHNTSISSPQPLTANITTQISSLAAMLHLDWPFGTVPSFLLRTRSMSSVPLLCESIHFPCYLKEIRVSQCDFNHLQCTILRYDDSGFHGAYFGTSSCD